MSDNLVVAVQVLLDEIRVLNDVIAQNKYDVKDTLQETIDGLTAEIRELRQKNEDLLDALDHERTISDNLDREVSRLRADLAKAEHDYTTQKTYNPAGLREFNTLSERNSVDDLRRMLEPFKDRKIECIKLVRVLTGAGLKESKDWVEKYICKTDGVPFYPEDGIPF